MSLKFTALFSGLVVFTFLVMFGLNSGDSPVPIGLLKLSLALLSDVISTPSYRLEIFHLS